MVKRKITWTKSAVRQLNEAIAYIRHDSPQNAEKVKERILEKVGLLADNKVVHRKDPHKKNNDGKYLYLEVSKYRIVYYTAPKEVFIIRLRHTSMEPTKY
ncbi:type II toxin-antitoxin system RelE/ParE family toxin [Niabella sp. CC-SYL272]|uniref:type II toxin-antitoxin system RelE/ParE family toxin n=1 Tax=Niabella agricola TaxID=2891571 RepID=UPI001F46B425|nr:type II toxin-antitoxin system RelE/ParE family toxin [Niabella agricola]MCF3110509.1 type II toxin-antitoxin system RelE/ParE family toxin [Niabella agricola]